MIELCRAPYCLHLRGLDVGSGAVEGKGRGRQVIAVARSCDLILLVVGTSLAVMPAASLLTYIDYDTPCALIDPDADALEPEFDDGPQVSAEWSDDDDDDLPFGDLSNPTNRMQGYFDDTSDDLPW